MKPVAWLLLTAFLIALLPAWAQPGGRKPSIGYVYPAGGQQGTVVQITAGGQFLRGVREAHVSGDGVRAVVVRHVGRFNLDGEQVRELARRLQVLWTAKQAAMRGGAPLAEAAPEGSDGKGEDYPELAMDRVELPDHPLIEKIEERSLRELAYLRREFRNFRKRQPNAQIAETVLIEVEIEPGAKPGNRELRLRSRAGLTNPLCFQVGRLPEVKETELNDPHVSVALPELEPAGLPVLLNGQIMPGDVDRFRFRARQGQQLVVEAHARSLIPYLADAVPGWFQATVAIYDSWGQELAYKDDFRFDPDPVLLYEVPRDGVYELEVRDSIYRGREDFVYRIAVGETPFVTSAFPLGAREGDEAVVSVAGWNLPKQQLRLDTRPGGGSIRQTGLGKTDWRGDRLLYAVDALPEATEEEPNDDAATAQAIETPRMVNGRIGEAGDVDVFSFQGRVGAVIVAEVYGRRLRSPLDSLLRLMDDSGNVIAWNDDYMEKDGHLHRGTGWLTHHADAYLSVTLPESGRYFVQISDAQGQGGPAYAYRLRIGLPMHDFALRVTPSSLGLRPGRSQAIRVHALRSDGFSGEIKVAVADPSLGFVLDGGVIPAGRDSIRMTITAPRRPFPDSLALHLEGRAQIGGKTAVRPVVPADNKMQAFLWRHLVPAQELLTVVNGPRYRGRALRWASNGPVLLPEGGSAQVQLMAPRNPQIGNVHLELSDAPKGLRIDGTEAVPEGLVLTLHADAGTLSAGEADNLIVEVFVDRPKRDKDGKPKKETQRISVGVLPALSYEVVQ